MAEVRIFDGESIESALRRFKRQVQQEGIIKEVKRHSFFLKPGEKKRLKSKLAQKLKRKKVRRQPIDSDSTASPRSRQSQYQPRPPRADRGGHTAASPDGSPPIPLFCYVSLLAPEFIVGEFATVTRDKRRSDHVIRGRDRQPLITRHMATRQD